jgi:hypothetical protein
MANDTDIGASEAGSVQTSDYQARLDSIAESIRKIQQPVDGDAGEYHGVGLHASMLEATAAVGKVAGAVVDGATGTNAMGALHEAGSGLGNDYAGNKDAANDHYIAAIAEATDDGLAGAAVAMHRTFEHLKKGEFTEALGDAVDAIGDIAGAIASPVTGTIEKVAEAYGQASEAFDQGSKMYDNAAQDADYAAAVANNATTRDEAVARLQEKYAEIVEQARQSGHEPEVASWYQARAESAAVADTLGLTPDYSAPEREYSPVAPPQPIDTGYSPPPYSPLMPESDSNPQPDFDNIEMAPLGDLDASGPSDGASREPAGMFEASLSSASSDPDSSMDSFADAPEESDFGDMSGEPGDQQDFSLDDPVGEPAEDLGRMDGNVDAVADGDAPADREPAAVEAALDGISLDSSTGDDVGQETTSAPTELVSADDGPSVLEEYFGIQEFDTDFTDNVLQLEDLPTGSDTVGELNDISADDSLSINADADWRQGSETASGDFSGSDWASSKSSETDSVDTGSDWSSSSNTTTDESAGGDWADDASDDGALTDSGLPTDSSGEDAGGYGGGEAAPADAGSGSSGSSSADSGDSGGSADSSSGTVV